MSVLKILLGIVGGLLLVPVACFSQTGNDYFRAGDRAAWYWDLATGVDTYLHTYALALEDTSEALAEFMLQAGFEGRSARQ